MRFALAGKTYSMSSIDGISLKEILLFNAQTESLGIKERWSDVERLFKEADGKTAAEFSAMPEVYLLMSAMIWLSRLGGGESITFEEAIDFDLNLLTLLPDPGDKKPGKARGGKKKKKAPSSTQPSEAPSLDAEVAALEAAPTPTT